MTIHFTTAAKEDIAQLEQYLINAFSFDHANKVLIHIEQEINLLFTFPELGKVPLYRSLRLQNYRYINVENQSVFYKVLDDQILIVRMIHQKQSLRLI